MATVSHTFLPSDGVPPSSAYARYDVLGTAFIPCLKFAATDDANETIQFYFRAVAYGSGNVTVKVDWYADTASSGDVVWDAALMCLTPNTDDVDTESASFATANTATDNHLTSQAQRPHQAAITITNTDSITAGDYCILKITRNTTAANADTMTGDANLIMVTVEYSDT